LIKGDPPLSGAVAELEESEMVIGFNAGALPLDEPLPPQPEASSEAR
jgi:hypothetical protein